MKYTRRGVGWGTYGSERNEFVIQRSRLACVERKKGGREGVVRV